MHYPLEFIVDAAELGCFERDIPRLGLLVIGSNSVQELVEDYVESLNANQLELESPVALPTVQHDLLARFGDGCAPCLHSLLCERYDLPVRCKVEDFPQEGALVSSGR